MEEQNKINTASINQLHEWWKGLEPQWKKAFNEAMLGKGPIEDIPNGKDLKELFECPNFRFAGPYASYPNLSFELTNLSGLNKMYQAEGIMITFHKIESIDPILNIRNLKSLYLNNNELVSLDGLEGFKDLHSLGVHNNKIVSIKPLEHLKNLVVLNINSNKLKTLEGLHKENTANLEQLFCLPNEHLADVELERLKTELSLKVS